MSLRELLRRILRICLLSFSSRCTGIDLPGVFAKPLLRDGVRGCAVLAYLGNPAGVNWRRVVINIERADVGICSATQVMAGED